MLAAKISSKEKSVTSPKPEIKKGVVVVVDQVMHITINSKLFF